MNKTIIAVISLLCLCFCANLSAQTSDPVNHIKYTMGGFKDANGTKLSKDQIMGLFDQTQFSNYITASNKYKNGWILTGTGAVLLVAGAALIPNAGEIENSTTQSISIASCIAGVAVGAVLCGVGIPKIVKGNLDMGSVADDYNYGHRKAVSMSVGTQQYGFGLAFNF